MILHVAVAVLWLPGRELLVEMARVLRHVDANLYEVAAVGLGEKSWRSLCAMVESGEADIIVTPNRSDHGGEPAVEVAGEGRPDAEKEKQSPSRDDQARRLLAMIDAGESIETIVRTMRRPSLRRPRR